MIFAYLAGNILTNFARPCSQIVVLQGRTCNQIIDRKLKLDVLDTSKSQRRSSEIIYKPGKLYYSHVNEGLLSLTFNKIYQILSSGFRRMTYTEGLDYINSLPDELIIYIFRKLPLESILEVELVCQRWMKLARDAAVWRNLTVVYSGKPGESEVSQKNLDLISSHSDFIFRLKLQYIYSYPCIISILEKCENLNSVELVMCRVSKELEEDLKNYPNLKKINFKNSILQPMVDDIKIQYDQFKSLNYLALSEFGLNSFNCYSLLGCKYLTYIYIEKIRRLTLEFITVLIDSKKEILKTFHVYGDDAIDDRCLQLLSQSPTLKDLAIIRCENLTDQGLVALRNLKLDHLQLWNNTNFTETNLLRTLGSPDLIKLQSLSLSRVDNVSPIIVDVISDSYKNLKFLALYQCGRIINTDYEKQLKSKFRNIDVVLY